MNTIDYSHTWTEQRDRGGLYHVNNNFFALTKAIELVCRHHLDVRTDPSDVMLSKIEEDALKTEAVTSLWETMTVSLDTASQKMDLLKSVIKLWSTIRIHSFAIIYASST